jgi:hypothetical protein
MFLRKDFLFPTKPLYGNWSSAKTWRPPDLATMRDFLRLKAATGQGMIMEQMTCNPRNPLNAFAE